MKRKNWILSIVIGLFVVVNIVLVVNDSSHKVDRVTFISDWTEAEEKMMQETLHKDGVLESAFENYVYLDDELGSFNEFLVDEGQLVEAGEDLYTYDVRQPYQMVLNLQRQEDELTESIDAIEQAINQIESTQITQEEFTFVYPDDSQAGTFRQNVSNAKMVKEQYIIEKEKELAEKQAILNSVETQLQDLQTGEETIAVESPYRGKVTKLNTSLENPLMTIEELELYAVGELSEEERMDVENGMLAEVTLRENDQVFDGSIIDIADDPKQLHLKGESSYPFYVQLQEEETENLSEEEHPPLGTDEFNEVPRESIDLNEEEAINEEDSINESKSVADDELTKDDLLQGYHVNVKVILQENPEATAIPKKLVHGGKTWIMTKNGKLLHRAVDTGITDGTDVEVESETVEPGDWLAIKPEQQFRNESQFITPLKPSRTNWQAIYDAGARKRSIVIGLLGR